MATVNVIDLVSDVLREIRVLNAIDPPSAEDFAFVLRRGNRLLDLWNADRPIGGYATQLAGAFAFTPSLSPHTIGPAGTFNVPTGRPVSIEKANWVSAGGIRTPINIRDDDWWQEQDLPALTSDFPSDLFYNPTNPLGQLFFWPVPLTAYSVELWTRTVLSVLVEGGAVDFAPGYQEAFTLTLAELCTGAFNVDMPARLPQAAIDARAIVQRNNVESLPLDTCDAGIPGGEDGWFDYRSGRYLR